MKFLIPNSNHFGNPLVTGDSSLMCRRLDVPQIRKCDSESSTYNNTDMYVQQKNRVPTSPGPPNNGTIYQDNTNAVSSTSNLTSTLAVSSASSTTIPSKSDSTRRYCHKRSVSYDSASIGLPSSYYPAGQDEASSNFEDIILEELEDFDELFGSSSSESTVFSLADTANESPLSKIRSSTSVVINDTNNKSQQ